MTGNGTRQRGVETLAGVPGHWFGKGHPDSWHPERNPEEQWVGRPHRPRRAEPAARKPPAGRAEAWELARKALPCVHHPPPSYLDLRATKDR